MRPKKTLAYTLTPDFILDVPSAPGGVTLSSIKSRSLSISWSTPIDGNSPILNYIIEYSNLPGEYKVDFFRRENV